LGKIKKVRADELLVLQGKADSRTNARALIMAGKVRFAPDSLVAKPATTFPEDTPLRVEIPPRFVSRGGEKLACALTHFGINPAQTRALDIGASTGGFSDCLLQNGAISVVCVDVGRGQLHQKLRNDPRVTNLEKINVRHLAQTPLPHETFDIVVMDLSFISLTKALVPAWARVASNGWLVALIKPQFEAGKAEADKGAGVIRDSLVHARVVESIVAFVREHLTGAFPPGVVESPVTGGDGNREFLLATRRIAQN
jgi:23S rRNA (cytidine1920-2'-O)/16S rRNA (cytidine1409-2'-O)-methyltransferase